MAAEARAQELLRRGPDRVSVGHVPPFTEQQAIGYGELERDWSR